MQGRFIDCTLGDPFLNVALEEALFSVLKTPVLRIWDNQRSVIIGRAQLARIETDLEGCRKKGIPIVRRFTAGGTVYNGPGNVNWSFLEPSQPRNKSGGRLFDAKRVFSGFADTLVRALAECSISCRYDPPNRIVNNHGKVSGMAAYMSSAGVICHGTLLMDADLKEVEELTTPIAVRAKACYPRSRKVDVANCGVERNRFVKALMVATDFDYAADTISEEERALALRLSAKKYVSDRWNLGDPFSLNDL